jgi:PelA/Pel-15E family pectate lyase
MGLLFLEAFETTGEAAYLEAAKDAADALVEGQLASGGWDYLIEFDPAAREAWYRRADLGRLSPENAARRRNTSTYDDDNTQQALRFLVALTAAHPASDDPRDRRHREARDYGLAKLMEAQRPSGGWPQRWDGRPADPAAYPTLAARFPEEWPREHPRASYYDHYTLNDDTQRDCILTLLDAARRLNRPDCREAALRGGHFLVRARLPEPQPAWAQQYNARMEPAWARAFEPPGVSTRESAGVISLLATLYRETGDTTFLEPLPGAIAWLRRSEIAPGRWARLYELGTNRPIYGDRDGRIHYRVEDLSAERQRGYAWQGSFGVPEAIAAAERALATDRGRPAVADGEVPKEAGGSGRAAALAPRVRAIIADLNADGRWLSTSRDGKVVISTGTYIANARLLCDYLRAVADNP